MNSRRWIFAMCLTCATLAVGLLPPREGRFGHLRPSLSARMWDNEPPADSLVQARRRLGVTMSRLAQNLFLSSWRDTALALLPGLSRAPQSKPVWIVRAQVPEERMVALQGIVRAAWQVVEPAPGITTIVLVVPDSFPPLRWAGTRALVRPSTILPAALGGNACVAVLPVAAILLRQDVALQALGPCAYYAQYGAPGPAVSKWLQWQSFETAAAFDWNGGPLPSAPASSAHGPAFSASGVDPGHLPDFNAPWTESMAGLRCRAGNLQSCGDALLTPSAPPYPYFTGMVQSRPTPGFRVWDYYGPSLNGFGELQREWFSDLVRTMGKERVGRFWRSEKPVEQAFSDAMGMSIAEWTRNWAIAREGAIEPGPQVPIPSALGSLGVAAVLATLGLYRAGRRQVG